MNKVFELMIFMLKSSQLGVVFLPSSLQKIFGQPEAQVR